MKLQRRKDLILIGGIALITLIGIQMGLHWSVDETAPERVCEITPGTPGTPFPNYTLGTPATEECEWVNDWRYTPLQTAHMWNAAIIKGAGWLTFIGLVGTPITSESSNPFKEVTE